jgi:hypothetical protein
VETMRRSRKERRGTGKKRMGPSAFLGSMGFVSIGGGGVVIGFGDEGCGC